MRKFAVALFLLVLVALVVVADRVGSVVAERVVADEIRDSTVLEERPDVDITGFPFLTQAFRGRYDRIEVAATDVDAGEVVLSRLDATLHDVRAPLEDVLRQDVTDVAAERVTALALIDYAALARSYAGQELSVGPEGDQLLLTGELQASDTTLQVEAVASVEVVDGDLQITAEEASLSEALGRQDLPQAVRELLDVRVPVGQLPYDLTLTGVEVRPDGVALSAESTDVLLSAE